MGVQHYKYRFCFKILFNPIAVAEGGGDNKNLSPQICKFLGRFQIYSLVEHPKIEKELNNFFFTHT